MRSFAASDRFVADVKAGKLAPGYVFIGDEAFFRKRCREAILQHLVPADVRELSLYDMDLAEVDLQQVLDRARTPSLMSPFQVFFVRGIKNLYGRGKHDDEFAAIADYFKRSQSRRPAGFYRRLHQHSGRRPPHGSDRQGPLRTHSRDLGRVLSGAGIRSRGRRRRGQVGDRDSGRRRRETRYRCRARTGGFAGQRHDDGRQRTGEAGAVRRREEAHHAGRCRDAGAGGEAKIVLRTDGCHLGARPRPGAGRARRHPEHGRWRRSRHRPSVHAGRAPSARCW